jgi:putative ABC transport system permease protein
MRPIRRTELLLTHLRRFSARHAHRAPWTTGSLIAIVALGVAVFFSVRLSNRAAVAGFQLFTQSVSGGSDYIVSGAGNTVPEERLPELRRAVDPLPVVLLPILEGTATLPGTGQDADDFDAAQVPIIGMDVLAARNLVYARQQTGYRPAREESDDGFEPNRFLDVFATQQLAKQLKAGEGDWIEAIVGDVPRRLHLAGVMVPDTFQAGKSEKLLIADLPALQQMLDMTGRVDRVEILVPEGANEAELRNATEEKLRMLGSEWTWSPTATKRGSAMTMTAAFRLNLTILSALSLLVGVYLIIQAMEAAVVRRRKEIGILLSMGCEPGWIRMAWLVESLLLGVVGSTVGLLLGWLLAQGSVRAIARTVNALYVNTTADAAAWDSGEAGLAFTLGVLTTVAAGLLPARDAAGTPPVQVMQRESRSEGIRLLDSPSLGIALLVIGFLFSLMNPLSLGPGVRFPLGGYLAATMWLIGAAVLAGNLLSLLPKLLKRSMNQAPLWRMAASQFRRPSGRQKLTVAGLVVAVGMAAGMEILIHSFERTVTGWIHRSLQADLFIAVKGVENASNRNRISQQTWRELMQDPDLKQADIGHFFEIAFRGAPTTLMGIRSSAPWSDNHLTWADRPAAPVRLDSTLQDGRWPALVSESFSTRYGLQRDDTLELTTPSGERRIRILGVYADYGNERGTIMMDGRHVSEWYRDLRAVNFAATLQPGVDPEQVRERWSKEFPGLAIRTNRALREEVIRIFHQTFAVTHVLKAIGISVAIGGLALALFSLLMDRRMELVTLRELGFRRRDIAKAVTIEGTLISIIGLAGGLLLSLALGYLLIFVINRQSFGWTLAYAVSPAGLGMLAAGVLLAAMGTSFGVGQWAGRLQGDRQE